jgi:acyl-CoA synthetase (AMP-forming)/AMP-acid ligase II
MSSWFYQRWEKYVAKVAFITDEGTWTYADLTALVQKYRQELSALALSGPQGFALIGDYSPAAAVWLMVLQEQGHWVVPLNQSATDHAEKLAQLPIHWVVRTTALQSILERYQPLPVSQTEAAETNHLKSGLVLFSSGTSGRPKIMVQELPKLLARYESRRENNLRILALLGFDHIGGLNTLWGALASGSTLVTLVKRDPGTVLNTLVKYQINVLPASPTFLNLLVVSGELKQQDLSALRLITYGTEPMPPSLLERLRGLLPQVRLVQTFGTTETGILQTESVSPDSTFLRFVDPAVEWKIIAGELWLRSQTQIKGYFRQDSAAFTDDGWFRTGDKVEQGPDGSLRILGREGESINVGGEKLMPLEVETILLEVPQVLDCRVYGAPNLLTGQTVVADIVAAAPFDPEALRAELRQCCRQRLPRYKVPTQINFVNSVSGNRFKKLRSL